jgi:flagellin-like protein
MSAFTDIVSGQAGVTGLETAIVLIAFVVVASVFSGAVLGGGSSQAKTSDSGRSTPRVQPSKSAPLAITRAIPPKADYERCVDLN